MKNEPSRTNAGRYKKPSAIATFIIRRGWAKDIAAANRLMIFVILICIIIMIGAYFFLNQKPDPRLERPDIGSLPTHHVV